MHRDKETANKPPQSKRKASFSYFSQKYFYEKSDALSSAQVYGKLPFSKCPFKKPTLFLLFYSSSDLLHLQEIWPASSNWGVVKSSPLIL